VSAKVPRARAKRAPSDSRVLPKGYVPLPREREVRVRSTGAEHIARAAGRVASCTWSAAESVRRLATTLGYGPSADVVRLEDLGGGHSRWKIVYVVVDRA